MIKLVWVTDNNDIIGHSDLAHHDPAAATRPAGLDAEINRIFIADNIVVGKTTLPLCTDYIPHYKSFYVLTRDKNFTVADHANLSVIHDPQELVTKYQDSKETLLVGGGKAIWELFLPHASELIIALIDSHPGDLKFDAWRSVKKTKYNEVDWKNGKTHYYAIHRK
ncbi:MAG: dihydrofolate reductase [Cellvibrionales bacterium]|nr:dihydrofolate reductase [Cellvibrionales bacterium]